MIDEIRILETTLMTRSTFHAAQVVLALSYIPAVQHSLTTNIFAPAESAPCPPPDQVAEHPSHPVNLEAREPDSSYLPPITPE